jgi:glycerol-3-phosphate cytidylyltransferase
MIKGFVASAFDLLHPGHILMLKEASNNCDYLIVGLHVDPSKERKGKNRPIETVFERYTRLQACQYVNQIIPYETEEDLRVILENFDIDLRFLGEEYIGKDNITAKDAVTIMYLHRRHDYSSTNLRKRL